MTKLRHGRPLGHRPVSDPAIRRMASIRRRDAAGEGEGMPDEKRRRHTGVLARASLCSIVVRRQASSRSGLSRRKKLLSEPFVLCSW